VPHLALGAELSHDYRERTVVMAYNAIFGVVGGASTFFLGWTYFGIVEGGTAYRSGYAVLAGGVAIFAALVIFASAFFTRDQIPRLSRVPADLPRLTVLGLLSEVRGCLVNRNYLVLLFGLFFLSATLGIRETIAAYVNLFFWELPEQQIRFFGLASPPGFVLAFILAPRLHTWFDKRETIIGSALGLALAAAGPITLRILGFFPPNGSPWLFPCLALAVLLAYGFGATLSISVMSALADVADEHELATGRRQEGIFYSARTFFAKLTAGLGHLLAGLAIDIIHFPTGAKPGEVDFDIVFRLGLLDGPIAATPALIAILFYARYRIDKARYAEIRSELARRRAS
jgi:Na+/melibiose symporter-like transporter